jgi:hypothetical protein
MFSTLVWYVVCHPSISFFVSILCFVSTPWHVSSRGNPVHAFMPKLVGVTSKSFLKREDPSNETPFAPKGTIVSKPVQLLIDTIADDVEMSGAKL